MIFAAELDIAIPPWWLIAVAGSIAAIAVSVALTYFLAGPRK